jgi:predicted RNase H-like nuclease (RuvC/YqgF family)
MHPVIVGIYPGTTSAFAVLSFDFKVIAVMSKKEYSLAGIIQDIYRFGNPILVGTDKKEVPSFIKEFSQKTGSKIFSPTYDTKKGEKLFIVKDKGFKDMVGNSHETDALASAIYAYNEYSQLIRKVEAFVEKNNKRAIYDRLLVKVITEDKNIADAVIELETRPVKKTLIEKEYPVQEKKELSPLEKELLRLKELIAGLKEELRALREENAFLKQKKIDISKTTKKTISFKENRALSLETENKALKKDLDKKGKVIRKLDEFISLSKDSVIIKKLKNLGSEESAAKKDLLKIGRGDVIMVDDISVSSAKVLLDLKEKDVIIIYDKGMNREVSSGFLLIEKKNLDLLETRHFALAQKERFEKEIEKNKAKESVSIKDILEEYRRERV